MDMAGNVWEWCLNKYDDLEVTTIDASGDGRVLRGGAWIGNPVTASGTIPTTGTSTGVFVLSVRPPFCADH
jgi:hypothetical protein